ncbi:zincin-like metallopeptidase toxin domain-containing protein [Empedobacter brevis]|uniref:zincin-like metallopeptidase toxin domain-containing protein n=1 Tax=Empedobacter brevis TaxID=247 RepID=UPI002576F0EF|nr:zincin-like metallopeptidase toxin domain-containing protein [Empedobacter brevis]
MVKNKDLLSPKYKEIADLTSKELDWMASRKIGNLGGNILKSIQIRKLRGILKQKGIILIVDGDVKNIVKLFKPIDNFKSFEELTLFMKNNNKVGLFHAGTKQMILTKNCTEIVAFLEMCHLKHFEEVGEIAYKGFSTIKKEMYVWKQILSNRSKWTEAELKDSLKYINKERKKAGITEPIKIK